MPTLARIPSLPPDSALGTGWKPPTFTGKDERIIKPQSDLIFTSVAIPLGPADEEKGRSCRSLPNNVLPIVSIVPVASSSSGDESESGGDDEFDDAFFGDHIEGPAAKVDFVERYTTEEMEKMREERQMYAFSKELSSQMDKVVNLDGKGRAQLTGIVDLNGYPVTEIPHHITNLTLALKHSPPPPKPILPPAPSLNASTSSAPPSSFEFAPRLPSRTFTRSQTTPNTSSSPFLTRPSDSLLKRVHARSTSGAFQQVFADTDESSTSTEEETSSPQQHDRPMEPLPIELFLARCELTTNSLTYSLWSIRNLTVLSLRHNDLDSLPPSICRLVNLTELTISNNRLTYLPAEITLLTQLSKLTTSNNPWLPIPSTPSITTNDRILSPTTTHFRIPSLSEICIRYLLTAEDTPTTLSNRSYSRFMNYELPTSPPLPDHLLAPFQLCSSPTVPQKTIKRSHKHQAQPFDIEANWCRHGLEKKVYYKHAVERLEWVTLRSLQMGALQVEGEKKVGVKEERVPILWRGCGETCLDWLEV